MDAKTKALRRNYDKLEDLERFKLAMAAYARDDQSELKAIQDTAPKAIYRMTAWPYGGMWDGLQKAVWATVTDILTKGWHLAMCWGLDKARSEYEEDEAEEDGDFIPFLAAYDYAEWIMADWASLALFCRSLGIELDHALEHAPATGEAAQVVDFARDLLIEREQFLSWLATEVVADAETGEDPEQVLADAMEALARTREEKAREGMELLQKIWEKETT